MRKESLSAWIRADCIGDGIQREEIRLHFRSSYFERSRLWRIYQPQAVLRDICAEGITYCVPRATHCKEGSKTLFGDLKKWKAVKDVLDFDDEGNTIFRDKPLSEKTLERIYAGLIKFVAGGKEAFLVKYNSMSRSGKYQAPGIDQPCPVVSTQNRLGLTQVSFLSKQYSGHPESKNRSVDEPAGTITAIDHHAFVSAYYGNGYNHSCEMPSPTLTTKDRLALIQSESFIDMQYGNGTAASISGNSDISDNFQRATEAFNVFVTKLVDPERFGKIAEKYNQIA